MPYVYLICSVCFGSAESIAGGFYNRRNAERKDITPLYSFLSIASVFLFWVIMFCFNSSLDWSVIPYSLLFAIFFTLCNVCMVRALKIGPIPLASLFVQLALIGSTIWGFFFWNTKFTWLIAVGLVLVVCSLSLCLLKGKEEDGAKINPKWLLYVALAFVGNAGCVITQRTQQMHFNGQYGNFLMMVATAVSMAIAFVLYIKSDKSDSKILLKEYGIVPVLGGASNGILNLFIILLASTTLSPSLIYPVIAVGSLMITTLVSSLFLKEKLKKTQWVGIFVGAVAVALLSI